jgi:hypothetical protein
MLLEVSFVLAIAAGVAYLFWMMLRNASQKIGAQFTKLADRFDLELTQPAAQLAGFNRPEPFVHGRYRDREISISVPGKGLQNTRQIETTLKIEVAEKNFSFQMTASGLLGGLRQRDSGGMPRCKSVETAFDGALDVRTDNDDRLIQLLDAPQREKILTLIKQSKGTIYLRGGVLAFAKIGLIAKDAERKLFEEAVEFFMDLAERIEA